MFAATAGVAWFVPQAKSLDGDDLRDHRGKKEGTKDVLEGAHQAATRRGETVKSAIAEHAWSRNHHPLWEETWIFDRGSHTTTLRDQGSHTYLPQGPSRTAIQRPRP